MVNLGKAGRVKHAVTLKKWRESKGLTQQELATELGIHVQYVSALERGARRPGMGVATRIREFTEGAVSIDQLVPVKSSERQAA
jgi:transcriptional regulator with XRE-family HTH domain